MVFEHAINQMPDEELCLLRLRQALTTNVFLLRI